MSTVVTSRSNSKIPNASLEKGGGVRRRDKASPPERAVDGENTASLVSRQSSTTSTTSDHDSGSTAAKDTQQTATKAGGGVRMKAAVPAVAPSTARALRSPLSKINVAPKGSKRPDNDAKVDPKARTSQNRSKVVPTSASTDPTSQSKDGLPLTSDKGGSRGVGAATSRQGITSGATRVGSAPAPRAGHTAAMARGTSATLSITPAKKAGTPASVQETPPKSSLADDEVTKDGQESIPNEPELRPKEMDTEPKAKESTPEPRPTETELINQLTGERDRLARALVDKEEEFRVRERSLLDKLQAVCTETKQPHSGGDVVDGSVETDKKDGEVATRAGEGGGGAVNTLDIVTAEDNEENTMAAMLKVEQMEAIQKEREMVILRGEQEIARLQLELQNSEYQLAQCRRELELSQSQLASMREQRNHAGQDTASKQSCDAKTGPVKALDEDVKHSSHLGNDSHICNQSSSCDSNHDDDDYRRGHDAKQNGVHGNRQADEPNECLEDEVSRPPMELMQWCRALVSDDHNWERRVGSEEEAALLEVVRECRMRIKEKLPAMGGDDGEGVWVFDADRKGSKGKQFRSDVDPICTVQDVKRMKPGDDLPSNPPVNRLLKKARRRSGGNGLGTKPGRSLDGSEASGLSEGSSLLDKEPPSSEADQEPSSPVAGTNLATPTDHQGAEGITMTTLDGGNGTSDVSHIGSTPSTKPSTCVREEDVHTAEVSPPGSPSLGHKPLPDGRRADVVGVVDMSVHKGSPTETEMLSGAQAIHLTKGGHEDEATTVEVHLQVLNSTTSIETDVVQKSLPSQDGPPKDDVSDGGWISLVIPSAV